MKLKTIYEFKPGNRRNNGYKDGGFTLIELLAGIAILGVVIALGSTMIIQTFDVFGASTERMSGAQLLEIARGELVDELRQIRDDEYDIYKNSDLLINRNDSLDVDENELEIEDGVFQFTIEYLNEDGEIGKTCHATVSPRP